MSLELWEYRWPKWNNPMCNCIIITLILQVSHPENIEMLPSCIHSGNKFLNSKGKCLEILVSGKIKTQTTPKIYLLVEESPLYRGKSMSFKPNQHWNSVALHIWPQCHDRSKSFDTPFPMMGFSFVVIYLDHLSTATFFIYDKSKSWVDYGAVVENCYYLCTYLRCMIR